MRWMKGAVEALHEGTEAYMTELLKDANLLAIHAHHITVQPRDIQLTRRIWGELNWDNKCQTVKVMATRPYYIRAISRH